jgi:hypothetical protein
VSLANMKHVSKGFSIENKLGNTVIAYDIAYLHDGNGMLMRNAREHLNIVGIIFWKTTIRSVT